MTFLSPLFLLALVPVALLALGYALAQRRSQRYAVRFATLPMLDKLVPARPRWRRHLPTALVLVALTSLGVAAARPQIEMQVPYQRATVVVAIDTSGSMLATDVEPNRLEAAKVAAAGFVAGLPENYNVAVVQFAGSASVISPATPDHDDSRRRIAALTTAGGGTAIGESIFQSIGEVARLAVDAGSVASAGDGEPVPARLVLLSDGDNTAGRSPQEAAQAAQQAGLPVSTIAYGTAGGSTTIAGESQVVPVDEDALRQIAQETGGQFYQARSSDQLTEVYDGIGTSIGYHPETVDITSYLALFGLVLAGVAGALSLRWFSRLI